MSDPVPAEGTAALGRLDLTVPVCVSRLDRATASTVAAATGSDRSQVSRRVAGFTAAGLVRRGIDGTDARAVLLVLTDEGERLLARHRADQARRLDVLTAHWTPESVTTLADGISRLLREITAAEPPPAGPTAVRDAGPGGLSTDEQQVWRSVLASADLVRTRVTQDLTPATASRRAISSSPPGCRTSPVTAIPA